MNKNILASALLALSMGAASAAGTSVGLTYDVEIASKNANHYDSQHEVKAYVAQDTKVGTFDAGLIGLRFNGIGQDDANGFEVGYSKGLSVAGFGLAGRVGVGRLNNIDPNGGGFTGNSKYYSLGVEGQAPLNGRASAFLSFRRRDGLGDGSAYAMNNRIAMGLDYAFTKQVTGRLGYGHTTQSGIHMNGAVASVAYAF